MIEMLRYIAWFAGIGLLASCTSTEKPEVSIADRAIRVVATTSIIADLATTIGGSEVEVESLMGPGVDPHLYQASARDVSRMSEADIVV